MVFLCSSEMCLWFTKQSLSRWIAPNHANPPCTVLKLLVSSSPPASNRVRVNKGQPTRATPAFVGTQTDENTVRDVPNMLHPTPLREVAENVLRTIWFQSGR